MTALFENMYISYEGDHRYTFGKLAFWRLKTLKLCVTHIEAFA